MRKLRRIIKDTLEQKKDSNNVQTFTSQPPGMISFPMGYIGKKVRFVLSRQALYIDAKFSTYLWKVLFLAQPIKRLIQNMKPACD